MSEVTSRAISCSQLSKFKVTVGGNVNIVFDTYICENVFYSQNKTSMITIMYSGLV